MLDEPPEDQRLQLLNDVWKVVMKLESPEVGTWPNYSDLSISLVPIRHFTS